MTPLPKALSPNFNGDFTTSNDYREKVKIGIDSDLHSEEHPKTTETSPRELHNESLLMQSKDKDTNQDLEPYIQVKATVTTPDQVKRVAIAIQASPLKPVDQSTHRRGSSRPDTVQSSGSSIMILTNNRVNLAHLSKSKGKVVNVNDYLDASKQAKIQDKGFSVNKRTSRDTQTAPTKIPVKVKTNFHFRKVLASNEAYSDSPSTTDGREPTLQAESRQGSRNSDLE